MGLNVLSSSKVLIRISVVYIQEKKHVNVFSIVLLLSDSKQLNCNTCSTQAMGYCMRSQLRRSVLAPAQPDQHLYFSYRM